MILEFVMKIIRMWLELTWICLYFGAIIFESSTPFSRTTSACVMHASVKQSKMHATASSGNSISHPTEQSRHFDTHDGFFLLMLLYGTRHEDEEDDDKVLDELANVTTPFDVDAP